MRTFSTPILSFIYLFLHKTTFCIRVLYTSLPIWLEHKVNEWKCYWKNMFCHNIAKSLCSLPSFGKCFLFYLVCGVGVAAATRIKDNAKKSINICICLSVMPAAGMAALWW